MTTPSRRRFFGGVTACILAASSTLFARRGHNLGRETRPGEGIQISRREYHAAIDQALQSISGNKAQSAGAEALAILLGNLYDRLGRNLLELLSCLDASTQQIGFSLAIGRTLYGRPIEHPRFDEVCALYWGVRLAAERGWDEAGFKAAKAKATRIGPRRHRAEADARHLAALWLIIAEGPAR